MEDPEQRGRVRARGMSGVTLGWQSGCGNINLACGGVGGGRYSCGPLRSGGWERGRGARKGDWRWRRRVHGGMGGNDVGMFDNADASNRERGIENPESRF